MNNPAQDVSDVILGIIPSVEVLDAIDDDERRGTRPLSVALSLSQWKHLIGLLRAREIQQAQGVGESGLDDLCQRLSEHGAKSGRRAATKRYNDGVPTHTEMLMGQAVDAIRRLATPQSSAPVVGDDLESKYNVLRNLLQRSWREVHIGTKKYQLTLTVTPEYLERIESALTGRG